MSTLDTTRPYGLVCGGSDGARYEQDGRLYDAQGLVLGNQPATPAPKRARAKPAEPTEPAPADDQLAAQLKD